MEDGYRAVGPYRQAQHDFRPIDDRSARTFDKILGEAVSAARHAFSATVADGEPVLITIGASNEVTLYRISEDLQCETISCGRLADGVLVTADLLDETNDSDAGLSQATYSHPALQSVGGSFTMTYPWALNGDAATELRKRYYLSAAHRDEAVNAALAGSARILISESWDSVSGLPSAVRPLRRPFPRLEAMPTHRSNSLM